MGILREKTKNKGSVTVEKTLATIDVQCESILEHCAYNMAFSKAQHHLNTRTEHASITTVYNNIYNCSEKGNFHFGQQGLHCIIIPAVSHMCRTDYLFSMQSVQSAELLWPVSLGSERATCPRLRLTLQMHCKYPELFFCVVLSSLHVL